MTTNPAKTLYQKPPDIHKPTGWPCWITLLALFTAILAIFVIRTWLAHSGSPPRLFAVFDFLTVLFSFVTILLGTRILIPSDWAIALALAVLLGAQVTFTDKYPLLELPGPLLSSLAHGIGLAAALLAGTAVMRLGGPVRFRLALGDWKKGAAGIGFGLLFGLPFAVLNVFAFSLLQGRPFEWGNPAGAFLDALQPAIVEEVVYRFAFLGLVWLLFRKSWPRRAVLIAGLLSLLVHNYAHLDDLFRDNPLFALGYGGVIGIIWGLPEVLLALRRDLESSIAFHWIQDFIRFAAGF